MNIRLTPEQERMVTDELKTGRFRNAGEVIGKALQALRERVSEPSAVDNGKRRQAVREMLAFAEKNRTPLRDISVKQLIHEGHRL